MFTIIQANTVSPEVGQLLDTNIYEHQIKPM